MPLEFLDECLESFVREYPADEQAHARGRFLLAVYEEMEKRTRDTRPVEPPPWEKRMSDFEAGQFEKIIITFGRHAGKTIAEIMQEDRGWLEWWCDTDFELKRNLRRYLRRK